MMWLRIALVSSLLTPLLHVAVLFSIGLDGIETPISELSRQSWGMLHTFALVLSASGHVALAAALGGLDRGRLWPCGRILLVLSGIVLLYFAYFFATAEAAALRGPAANDPLWTVGSVYVVWMMGMALGLVGGARQSSRA